MTIRTGRPRPVDREVEFYIHELFFSTTDLVGNITSGNSVFQRVSQYEKSELIGAPHNIIRHPEMPKVVFKVLWDYLKAKKSVVAYVKNMAKDGRYYWVVAVAFPIANGYLSIRIKPSSEIFGLMPSVYTKLLTAEETGGMDASMNLLLGIIKSKGFDNYDAFMSTVLIEELNSRKKLLKTGQYSSEPVERQNKIIYQDKDQAHHFETLKNIKMLCSEAIDAFERLFKDFSNLLTVEETLRSRSVTVLNFSEQISILSLNVNIKSYFAQEAGRTISVVAKTIRKKSEEIKLLTQSIVRLSKDISGLTQRLGFYTAIPRLQTAMINAFTQELLSQAQLRKISEEEIVEIKKNILVLINLFINSFSQLNELLSPIGKKVNEILVLIDLINSAINELERCNFLGNIEAAVIGEKGINFIYTFNEVKESSESTRESLLEFRRYLNGIIETTRAIYGTHTTILSFVEAIKSAVDQLEAVPVA